MSRETIELGIAGAAMAMLALDTHHSMQLAKEIGKPPKRPKDRSKAKAARKANRKRRKKK